MLLHTPAFLYRFQSTRIIRKETRGRIQVTYILVNTKTSPNKIFLTLGRVIIITWAHGIPVSYQQKGIIGNNGHLTGVFLLIGWTVYFLATISLNSSILHKHLNDNVPEGENSEFVDDKDPVPRESNTNEHVVEIIIDEEEEEEEDYNYKTPGDATD